MLAYVALTVLVAFLSYIILWQNKKIRKMEFMSGSRSSKCGKTVEQLIPLSKNYPFNPGNFRFLGNPIDGIQFEEDKIILVEFKYGKSKLSATQRKIKNIVKSGKVEFVELRIK